MRIEGAGGNEDVAHPAASHRDLRQRISTVLSENDPLAVGGEVRRDARARALETPELTAAVEPPQIDERLPASDRAAVGDHRSVRGNDHVVVRERGRLAKGEIDARRWSNGVGTEPAPHCGH